MVIIIVRVVDGVYSYIMSLGLRVFFSMYSVVFFISFEEGFVNFIIISDDIDGSFVLGRDSFFGVRG